MSTESSVFESLSPAEAAYFSSKGSEVSGLDGNEQPAEQTTTTQQEQPNANGQEQTQQAQDDGDEGIYIDESGKARSVVTGKFVPHGAFHKERERRKASEAELQTTRERMARADERLAVLNEIISAGEMPQQQAKQPQAVEAPMPDPETDIFGYVKWLAEKNQRLEAQVQATVQQRERDRVAQDVQQFYRQDAMQFLQQTPDFADAYQYVAQSYSNELAAQGYTPQQIQAHLMNEEARIAYECRQKGQSPSKVIYDMAKARGFGRQAPAPAAPAPTADKKLETIQRGQKASASLSGAGGSSGEGLTLEALANMNDDEFAAVQSKLGRNKFRQLLGG